MARNLVICCDGTNNSHATPLTNVGHLSELADIDDPARQMVFYDAGVGAEAEARLSSRIGAMFSRWSGSAFGTGLVENVSQAYTFLLDNYSEGDKVFLFGFSRGAYTVRVIAGLLYNYGLLRKEHARDAELVVRTFQKLYPRDGTGFVNGVPAPGQLERLNEARRIRETRSRNFQIHFMGLFDTVSSLGWAWDPKSFPNTSTMSNVNKLRHAMAIDERRAKFRTNRVRPMNGCDHKQMWFAGVHSDVGGGYEAPRNRLSRVPLRWMLREAYEAGLLINEAVLAKLDLETTYLQDEQAEQNESLTVLWRTLEYLPLPHREQKNGKWVEGRRIYGGNGWRELPDTFDAHESLRRRRIAVKNVHWRESQANIHYRN